jgi:phospholipid/cholesterol/gamma-HCH transport system ATP-binding protein
MTTLLEIKGITNKFGSKVVHDGISLTLKKNEILGLVGSSGSGKSVLLRTILGLHAPQKGKVLIEGVDIYALSPEERLRVQNKWGVLFQNGALFSGLSVLDNVALPLREHTQLSAQAVENLAFLKLEMVGLEPDTADKYPAALSGGMVTRAALARAMALDPGILFLDEPTGALDAVAATALDELMLSLQKVLNLSILIITHDLDTLVTICDRIAMIADKKIEVGTLDEMLKSSNPEVHEYFSGPRMKAVLAKQGRRK